MQQSLKRSRKKEAEVLEQGEGTASIASSLTKTRSTVGGAFKGSGIAPSESAAFVAGAGVYRSAILRNLQHNGVSLWCRKRLASSLHRKCWRVCLACCF